MTTLKMPDGSLWFIHDSEQDYITQLLDNGAQLLGQGDDWTLDAVDVSDAVRGMLRARGLDTRERLAAASDADLLALPGVGKAILRRIRAAIQ